EEALLGPGDHQAHLVQVGVQHHPGGVFPAAPAHPDDVAEFVLVDLVHQGSQEGAGQIGHRALPAGGAVAAAQSGQGLADVHCMTSPAHSSLTMALNVCPRWAKFLKWSKEAQAGERITTSPSW